jgi:hypothetical protein
LAKAAVVTLLPLLSKNARTCTAKALWQVPLLLLLGLVPILLLLLHPPVAAPASLLPLALLSPPLLLLLPPPPCWEGMLGAASSRAPALLHTRHSTAAE